MELGGVTPGVEHDQLDVIGTAPLAGPLDVSLIGGFAWEAAQAYVILAVGLVTGTFDTVSGPGDLDVVMPQAAFPPCGRRS